MTAQPSAAEAGEESIMALSTEQQIDKLGVVLTEMLSELRHLRADMAERPSATSSCEIKTSARGADVTVKAYDEDVTGACDAAMGEYARVVAELNDRLAGALNGKPG